MGDLPERLLCMDGNCIGTLNERGYCNVCGKSLDGRYDPFRAEPEVDVKSQTVSDKPQFPIRLVWLESGEIETYEDERDLLCNLEDFPTGDEAKVTDALGRPVYLVVRIWEGLCQVYLENPGR